MLKWSFEIWSCSWICEKMQVQTLDFRGKFLTHFGSPLPKNEYGFCSSGWQHCLSVGCYLSRRLIEHICQVQGQVFSFHARDLSETFNTRSSLPATKSVAASTAGVPPSPRIPITDSLRPYTYRIWDIYRSRGLHNAPLQCCPTAPQPRDHVPATSR